MAGPSRTIVKLPLRLRMLVHEHGSDGVFPSVRCPRTNRSIDALTCMGCARMRSVEWDRESGGVIECRIDATAPCSDGDVDRRADLAEAAARRPLHAMMAFEDVPLVAVTGEDGELVGVWTATAALRWTAGRMGWLGS